MENNDILLTKEMFSRLIQVGVIVKDKDHTLEKYKNILGMDKFRIAKYPPDDEPNCERIYMGKDGNFSAYFCFFNYDNIELEVIQPIEGENIWSDFLSVSGDIKIHHLKYLVKDHKAVEEHFKKFGIKKIQSGASVGINKGKVWAFYDTMDLLGFYTEVMNELPDKA